MKQNKGIIIPLVLLFIAAVALFAIVAFKLLAKPSAPASQVTPRAGQNFATLSNSDEINAIDKDLKNTDPSGIGSDVLGDVDIEVNGL